MGEFYRQYVRERKLPAEALSIAQMTVRAQRKWSDPYFWAGFTVVTTAPRLHSTTTGLRDLDLSRAFDS
jgi:hypothetical protein